MYMNASDLTEFSKNDQPYFPASQTMRPGSFLSSPDKTYRLILQEDMNLVLYKGGQAVWAANSDTPYSTEVYGKNALRAWPVQNCAVMYTGLNVVDNLRGRTWGTLTSYASPDSRSSLRSYAILQDDGNVVINRYLELFMSDPQRLMVPDDMGAIYIAPNQVLNRGDLFKVGEFTYVFQEDGNFVIYDGSGVAVWHTHTNGSGANKMVMQEDGNLVIYRDNIAVWNSQTAGNPGAYASLQSNGNLVIVHVDLLWARFGFVPKAAPPPKKFKGGGTNLGTGVQDSLNPIKFPSYTTWTWNF